RPFARSAAEGILTAPSNLRCLFMRDHEHAKLPDPREAPAYALSEAAHYLDIPRATLRAWCLGQQYVRDGETRLFRPVLHIADSRRGVLSFFNLIEAHVLDALRRRHEVSLQKVRRAL